jgi:hypothetical protein
MTHMSGSTHGVAVASGAVGMALIGHLVEAGVITARDAQAILENAIDGLMPHMNIVSVGAAIAIIRDQLLPLFAENGISKS